MKKILVIGPSGSGKNDLAEELTNLLDGIHITTDDIDGVVVKHLGDSLEDQIEQASILRDLSDDALQSGKYVIVDFVCPTRETRKAFEDTSAFVVWVDRVEDKDKKFEQLKANQYDVRVHDKGTAQEWAAHIKHLLDFPLNN